MAGTKITIRLFSVTEGAEELVGLLEGAKKMDVADRNKPSSQGGFARLHDIREEKGGLWLMHFVRSREAHGPIKVSEDGIERVTYGEKQKPGEDIAALYALGTRHMLVQESGHFRVTPVRDYLNLLQGAPIFNMEPVPADFGHFNPDRLKMVHFQLEPQWFSDRHYDEGMSLERVLAMGHGDESVRVEIKISTTKKGAVLPQWLRKIPQTLSKSNNPMQGKVPDDVTKLRIGVLNPDNKADILNLRNPLVEADIPMNLDAGRVFPLEERYKALVSQHEKWATLLKVSRESRPD